jgi:hypothetical protein
MYKVEDDSVRMQACSLANNLITCFTSTSRNLYKPAALQVIQLPMRVWLLASCAPGSQHLLVQLYRLALQYTKGTCKNENMMSASSSSYINGRGLYNLGTPSLVSSWNRYVMIDPIFGGFLRCLSESPEPTLNFLPDSISHWSAPVMPARRPFPETYPVTRASAS